ncbi:chemotaxis protein CheB [Hymenobacter siberiensis]|jgi:two-component system chemotaxis response regulator CheB|uniref:chemotaxis protein CheB n=1 Tax=Hymenobacter siberiensis TaxID=2848396 RepID=UPI001C1E825D|nr:chemotaxis protein CheB [Hymenobacter siberiensis]MBU6122641.1 chemotaxis protein CheB [Hymenobacter siberiensis]
MSAPAYLIVVGTSAGGMPALVQFVAHLPAALPAAILVVQHFAPDSNGQHLVERLARHTTLPCRLPTDGETLAAGTIYLAPPDRHLLAKDGSVPHLLVTKGPRENHYRPAADALFRSAAVAYGARTVGIVLTGMLHDGTAGLEFIKRCGGIAIVQDPSEAEFPSMPESALHNVDVDYVVPLGQMAALLEEITHSPAPPRQPDIPEDLKQEATIAERVVGDITAVAEIGHQVPLTCPDCGGSLWQVNQGKVLRYRCHTGHAFTAGSLLHNSQQHLEETLWVALRMMEERKNLLTGMAARGTGSYSAQQEERLDEIKKHINRLREFLLNDGPTTIATPED